MLAVPAVHTFPGILPKSYSGWGWHDIRDLSKIAGCHPKELTSRYIALSQDGQKLHVSYDGSSAYFIREFPVKGFRYVPAGWRKHVLQATREGIYRVIRVAHQHTYTFFVCPEGTIPWMECMFDGHDFIARVGLNDKEQPYWTYDQCPHDQGNRKVAGQYRCLRCGVVIGGGK